jgi:hypothetical protein
MVNALDGQASPQCVQRRTVRGLSVPVDMGGKVGDGRAGLYDPCQGKT